MDKKTLEELMVELKPGLNAIYGNSLKSLYLYGSYARGEQDEESDLDVLVVLDRVDRSAREVDRTGELVSDLSLKYGITVSPVFVREADWLHGDTPFLSNVREEVEDFLRHMVRQAVQPNLKFVIRDSAEWI